MNKKYVIQKLFRQKSIARIEKKIALLGPFTELNSNTFLLFRFLISIFLFLLLFFFAKYNYLIAPLGTIFFYYGFEKISLDYPIKKRAQKLEEEAIFFFEIVNLTLESSHNLKFALQLTANNVEGELAEEFKNSFKEMRLGKSFNEVIKDMKERIPSDAVNSILLNLTEASIFGASIMNTINTQIEYLQEKKLMEIKALINKLPTKISIISVLFFIPIMLLIILGPVLLEYLT